MCNVYVLRSTKNKKRYIGFTSRDPEVRLHDHNTGSDDWTRRNSPFELIHKEGFDNKKEAMAREKFLKSGQGRKLLDILFPPSSVGRAGSARGGPASGWGCP